MHGAWRASASWFGAGRPCSRKTESRSSSPRSSSIVTITQEDADRTERDAVRVITVHRAKGLEFARVFVSGLVDGSSRFARGRRHSSCPTS